MQKLTDNPTWQIGHAECPVFRIKNLQKYSLLSLNVAPVRGILRSAEDLHVHAFDSGVVL